MTDICTAELLVDESTSLAIKRKLIRQFGKAAVTYNASAQVQLDIAKDAMSMLPEQTNLMLDIGCGTGRNSQTLENICNQLFACDLSFGMVQYANAKLETAHTTWVTGEAEHLPFCDSSFDCVFSSMALQWCQNMPMTLNEVSRVLKPNGSAVLAIMCDGSLHQLANAWKSVDGSKRVNTFLTASLLKEYAELQGFNCELIERVYTPRFTSINELLGSIKNIGANIVTDDMNRQKFDRNVLKRLGFIYGNKFSVDNKLPLDYRIAFLKLDKA